MKLASIVTFEEFDALRPTLGKIVCTSAPCDPIHPGHLSSIYESKKYGDTLVVIVNGDNYLKKKKGKAFMDLKTRCQILTYVNGVDYVIPFEIENDQTVIEAIKKIKPNVFTKGGDRFDASTIPEWNTCKENNVEIITGVGLSKQWNSSDFLKEWGEFWKSTRS